MEQRAGRTVLAAAIGGGTGEQALPLPRRGALLAALQAASLLWAHPSPAAEEPAVLTVGAGKQFVTIGAALEQAGSGATIEVAGGRSVALSCPAA